MSAVLFTVLYSSFYVRPTWVWASLLDHDVYEVVDNTADILSVL